MATKDDDNSQAVIKAADEESAALPFESPAKDQSRTLKPEGIIEFFGVIRDEMEIRKKDQTLREKETDNAHTYALKALDVQASDLKDQRTHKTTTRRDYLIGGCIAVICVVGFLIYCMQSGNQNVAVKVIEVGGTALLSGVSGYFYGKHKGYSQGVSEDDSLSDS